MADTYFKDRRFELHEKLVEILGTRNVYFQPPESIKIIYPAIIYERYDIPIKHADDKTYLRSCKYRITIIDQDPDSLIVDKMSLFDHCRFVKHFTTSGLNHDVFNLFY